jgi:hypothetical protein
LLLQSHDQALYRLLSATAYIGLKKTDHIVTEEGANTVQETPEWQCKPNVGNISVQEPPEWRYKPNVGNNSSGTQIQPIIGISRWPNVIVMDKREIGTQNCKLAATCQFYLTAAVICC